MRNVIIAAAIAFSALSASVAMAEDFGGQNDQAATAASVDRQAAASGLADPTSPDSVRSHGRP